MGCSLWRSKLAPKVRPGWGILGFGAALASQQLLVPWSSPIIALSPVLDAGYLPDGQSVFGFAAGGVAVVLMGDSLGLGRKLLGLRGNVISPRHRACRVELLPKADDQPETGPTLFSRSDRSFLR